MFAMPGRDNGTHTPYALKGHRHCRLPPAHHTWPVSFAVLSADGSLFLFVYLSFLLSLFQHNYFEISHFVYIMSAFHLFLNSIPLWGHCFCCLVTRSCSTLCNPMDHSPPGSSVHGILRARTLEGVATLISRGSSWPGDQTCVSCIGRSVLYHWATREALCGYTTIHFYVYLLMYIWTISCLGLSHTWYEYVCTNIHIDMCYPLSWRNYQTSHSGSTIFHFHR